MNVTTALSQLNSLNTKFESVFHQLELLFPQLTNRNAPSVLSKIHTEISSIGAGLDSGTKTSETAASFSERYTPIFDKLNEKISDLQSLDKMIAEIKEDSEQMELIALNAMVISVKSGEKGLAFSRITENLQRLSKDMFLYSDKLFEEEKELLEQINSLKAIFTGIISTQKTIASKDSECSSEIRHMISNVTPVISSIENQVSEIYPSIEKTSTVLGDKAAIKAEFKAASSALSELEKNGPDFTKSQSDLDFAISAFDRAYSSISKISSIFSQNCMTFAGNWGQVIDILDQGDNSRMEFESRFLNNHAFGNDNLLKQISSVIEKYQSMISEFSNYHLVQKDLHACSQSITSRAKSIYSVFESLRPVMNRLHHVRILQQIEVSKNEAIKSVQDSVTDMDNLINSANFSLDNMQEVLESFINDTGEMLKKFTSSIARDNEAMLSLKNDKEVIFGDLNNGKSTIEHAFQTFTVFPDNFQNKCVVIQQNLQDFMRLNSEVGAFASELESEKIALLQQKTH